MIIKENIKGYSIKENEKFTALLMQNDTYSFTKILLI